MLDAEMAKKLRDANPEAFRNIVARAIEAQGRGLWNADEEKLEKLRELYESTEDELEGVTV
jgi:magnesium chelatase subunit H